ncbi:endo-1,4-beta-xylanase [Mrakia frigida]|uniref:endo-1,4-beta-xylanase n=1 Tax=Mrakia frigida TaxID=29902 RepID=UPI003FCBFD99
MFFISPTIFLTFSLSLFALTGVTPVQGIEERNGNLAKRAVLRELAASKGKYFGTATLVSEFQNDATYRTVGGNFGVITPGNELKWDATESSQGVFTFTNADAVYTYATSIGAKVRGHTLVWYSQLPQWVKNISDKTTLTAVLTKHINTVVGRYKGKTMHWDVVNEAFNEDGTHRTSVFHTVLGTGYIATALKLAAAADPSAKLYINDYNVEGVNAKSNALLALCKSLLAAGVPLHGVGFQSHFTLGQVGTGADLATNMARFTALGLDVAITELDIRLALPATTASLAAQANDYKIVTAACVKNAKCVGITVWDFTDKYSWIPSVFPGYGAALLWDANYKQKPAYASVVAALGG